MTTSPRRQKPPKDEAQARQSASFKESALELGADESEDSFKKVVRQIGKVRPKDEPAPVKQARTAKQTG